MQFEQFSIVQEYACIVGIEKTGPKKKKSTVILQASRKMTAKSVDNQAASLIMRVMMRGSRHEEVCVCC